MPTHLVAFFAFFQTHKAKQKMQKSYQTNAPKTLQTMDSRAMINRTPAGNSGLAKWRVTCFYETFVVKQTVVHLMNFSAKIPPLRQAANRYTQL